jgi:hypothetical protein
MSSWKSANLGAVLPSQLTGMVSPATDAVDAILEALSIVNTGLGLAKNFLSNFGGFDFVAQLAVLVQNFKNDFQRSGIYYLGVWDAGLDDMIFDGVQDALVGAHPDDVYAAKLTQYFQARYIGGATNVTALSTTASISPNQGNSWTKFIQRITNSFTDPGDLQRPVFTDSCAAVILVAGAPSLAEFTTIITQVRKLFPSTTELDNIAGSLLRASLQGVGPLWAYPEVWPASLLNDPKLVPPHRAKTLLTPNSTPPDWRTFRFSDIDFLSGMFELVNNVLTAITALLKTGANSKTSLLALVNAISTKVQKLQALVAQIDSLLQNINDILGATGIYALYVSTGSGTTDLVNQIKQADASQVPFSVKTTTGTQQDAFLTGICLLAGGPEVPAFEKFFSLI